MSADTPSPAVDGSAGKIDDPTDLTWGDYKVAMKATKEEIKRDDVPSMAAGVAFRIFLSLFPALIAAVAIWGWIADPARLNDYVARLQGVIPDDALGVIERQLASVAETTGGQAALAAIPSILVGLWAASSAAAMLVKALNRAYEVPESRGFVKQRAVALAITFALLFSIAALIVLLVAGPQVQSAVVPEQLQGPIANVLFGILQGLLALGILIVLFAFVYWIGPNRELPRWVWMSPGAVVGVLGWLIVSLAFTLYVQNFGNYDQTYGALAGVVIFMLWLQLSMQLLLIGGEFNAEVERIRAQNEALRSGSGMGHLADVPDVVDVTDAAVLGAPIPPVATSAAGGGRPPATREAAARDRGGASTATARPQAGPQRQSRAATGPPPATGSTALLAGAAAAAAALAAVVGAVRRRD